MSDLYFGDGTKLIIGSQSNDKSVRSVPFLKFHHRGYYANHFEETMPALYESLKVGSDGFECDPVYTKDGVLVLAHANPITDVNGVQYSISGTNYADLKNVILDSSTEFGNVGLVTFEEALDFCFYHNCWVIVDSNSSVSKVTEMANLVAKHGMKERCIFILWNHYLDTDLVSIANAILSVIPNCLIQVPHTQSNGTTQLTINRDTFKDINCDTEQLILDYTTMSQSQTELRKYGYKLYCTNYSNINNMDFNPDFWLFEGNVNINEVVNNYLATIDFGKGIK